MKHRSSLASSRCRVYGSKLCLATFSVVLLLLSDMTVARQAVWPVASRLLAISSVHAAENAVAPPRVGTHTQTWGTQSKYILTLGDTAATLHSEVPGLTQELRAALPEYEEELYRLLVLGDSYSGSPRVLEAVARNMGNMVEALEVLMTPAEQARTTARSLLERVIQLEKSLSASYRALENLEAAQRNALETLVRTKNQLAESISDLDATLAGPQALLDKVTGANRTLEVDLPALWEQQYLMPPLRQTYMELWGDMGLKLKEAAHHFALRLDMEVPQSAAAWGRVGLRFATVLFFGLLLVGLLRRKAANAKAAEGVTSQSALPPGALHTSVFCLLTGAAVVVGAIATAQVYQGLLALGSILLIAGQVSLAWALRRPLCAACPARSPLWPLCVTSLAGYILLYPALPLPLLAFIWMGVLVLALLWQRRASIPLPLHLETTLLRVNAPVLWLSMFLLFMGMPRQSILLYILFTALGVALQLGMGGMHSLHVAAQKLPKDGIKALLGSIWLACVAPLMLLMVLLAATLWAITLPGGYFLIHTYALAGFSIGETHFNMVQALLILSVFYIARTAVHMGSGLISRMPERGIRIDPSLVPPLQTAFTYGIWALFGLFVLKALGLELSNLAVVAGGLSVGIGFGMQAIVNNFLSGLILIFSRIMQVGDVVDIGGLTGTVRKISVRATTVETADNAVIYVPNSEFVSSRLINWTRNCTSVRREVTVGVAYGTDTDQVLRLLLEAAMTNPQVLHHPAPSALLTNFGDNTLDFTLCFWVQGFYTAIPAASRLRQDIEKLFRQHNVDVAFPQLDVHIKEAPAIHVQPGPTHLSDRIPQRLQQVRKPRRFRPHLQKRL